MRWRCRRWFSLIAVLTLVWGGAAVGGPAADLNETMVPAADACEHGDRSSSGGCELCGDGGAMPAAACASLCGVRAAAPPGLAPVEVFAGATVTPLVVSSETGRLGPPDPYPPRPAILS